MTLTTRLGDITRSAGDPSVVATGRSSLTKADRGARMLGWLSIGLGIAEMMAAPAVARATGTEGREAMVRAAGARELVSGALALSVDARSGLVVRLIGDAVDAAALVAARRGREETADLDRALALVGIVTVADAICLQALRSGRSRKGEPLRSYAHRSGFPLGLAASRGLASTRAEPPAPR